MFDLDVPRVWILPRMSRCCSERQLLANTSMSESQTVRLAVRKSLRRRGRPRARYWKQPVLLWSVGHQPRSNSSSILVERRPSSQEVLQLWYRLQSTEKKKKSHLQPLTSSTRPRSVRFLQRHRSSEQRNLERAASMLATTS